MKYKPGDKVRIKSLDWYETNKDGFGYIFCNHICFDEKMTKFCGKTVTIAAQRNEKYYFIMEDNCLSFWSEDMIECFVEPQDKMISLNKACEWLKKNMYVEPVFEYDEDEEPVMYVCASACDSVDELINNFRKTMEE